MRVKSSENYHVFMEQFPQTSWTLINSLKEGTESEREVALKWVSENYWQPIYSFLRASGKGPEAAEDLTQQFFEKLLTENILEKASRERGKVRSLLLGALKRMLSEQERSGRALKRGSGCEPLSLDVTNFEVVHSGDFSHQENPEQLYLRCWAWSLVETAQRRLAEEFRQQGRSDVYAQLEPYLQNEESRPSYVSLAKALNSTPGAVRLMVHRVRRRLRALLEEEVSCDVGVTGNLAEELQWILATLRTRR